MAPLNIYLLSELLCDISKLYASDDSHGVKWVKSLVRRTVNLHTEPLHRDVHMGCTYSSCRQCDLDPTCPERSFRLYAAIWERVKWTSKTATFAFGLPGDGTRTLLAKKDLRLLLQYFAFSMLKAAFLYVRATNWEFSRLRNIARCWVRRACRKSLRSYWECARLLACRKISL